MTNAAVPWEPQPRCTLLPLVEPTFHAHVRVLCSSGEFLPFDKCSGEIEHFLGQGTKVFDTKEA